eukprot:TRINITY_DN171_c1_g2_i1.p1 TRINITY_DN171_c1_g2~~TRINITY_DN171_c1_g2_i1.p1  ORF type:complete len:468 (-),score=126.63 TRINITY_DN171_c1_g2_i1:1553-2956(-)
MSSSEGDDTLEPHILDKFEIIELLGKGAYGVVWKVIDRKTKEIVALKKIFKAFQNATDSQRTYREVHLLRQLKHEHIIKLHRIIKAENGEDLYLVFEYMDSDLHYAIRTGILEEDHKRYLIYQMLKGLLYIHSANVIHRDIKPENMLINTACELKIADFGLSRSVDEGQDDENYPMTDYVATRWYRSPEILFGSSTYTKGVDLWAIGCIVAELYGERPIFPGKSTVDQLRRIVEVTGRPTQDQLESASLGSDYSSHLMSSIPQGIVRSLSALYPQCDDDAIDFMECCFKFDPRERITVEEALAHPYLEAFREVDEEIRCDTKIKIPISDNIRKQMDVYRDALYELCDNWDQEDIELDEIVEQVVEKKRHRKKRRRERESKDGTKKKRRKSSKSSKRDSSSSKKESGSKRDSSKRDSSKKTSSTSKRSSSKDGTKKKSRNSEKKEFKSSGSRTDGSSSKKKKSRTKKE